VRAILAGSIPVRGDSSMTRPVEGATLLAQMRWRYSVKRFDKARKIAPEEWAVLEEALVLTPSSYGIQPWKFIVVTDQPTKEKLVPLSWNQQQVADCSHVVVFCARKPIAIDDVEAHLARMVEVRGLTPESLAKFRNVLVADLLEGARSWKINEWAANQVYIALGNFLTCAAQLGIDACPMEGFDPAKYDQLLGLPKRRLGSVVVCCAGYRGADDKYATTKKVRFPIDQVIERI
jgi:nitroreductase